MEIADHAIIRYIQSIYFKKEILELKNAKLVTNKAIRKLNPFLQHNDGLIRVGGRLRHAPISYNQKHPILLPSKCRVVELILTQAHHKLLHSGAQTVLSYVKMKYWPIDGLRQIKRLIRKCVNCFRFMTPNSVQQMADMHPDRVLPTRPFQVVSVDYGGFFLIKSSHLRKAPLYKAYVAYFICMSTKCVHIELVTGLSAEAYILTLKRFIARRSTPSIIWSDNATNFHGAKNEMREFYDFFLNQNNSEQIKEFCTQNSITFKMGVPRNPHQFGLHEVGIKSVKYHLYRIIGNSHFTFEAFNTVLCQIEAILNSRPITRMSSDANDFAFLSPAHFLVQRSLTAPPEPSVSEIPENRLNLFQRISKIQQQFWKLWKKDYLCLLQQRNKWTDPTDPVKIGDLVLLKEDGTPPLLWPTARVIDVLPGKDGLVRTVKIHTTHGDFLRGITKIAVIPLED
ncbi:uncharacterized protein LOC126889995 [Diabrotica virgifera virgifera]|uniref:Integrase catalytic domain-containing protein n=1 Tax=Diabrotica virgifera virgifera TaxID=50390 RepID=A0ABM5KX33_DIAVI|nr:uncharacterized protein LOC126889995 [Diabrotica virgifera virgifera]